MRRENARGALDGAGDLIGKRFGYFSVFCFFLCVFGEGSILLLKKERFVVVFLLLRKTIGKQNHIKYLSFLKGNARTAGLEVESGLDWAVSRFYFLGTDSEST